MTANAPARGGRGWLQGVCAGACAVALPGPALATAVLLAPALAGLALEDTPGRPASRAMLIMGLAAALHPLRTVLETDWSLSGTLALLADPSVPLAAWFCCGLGWLVGAVTEAAARLWLTRSNAAKLAALAAERKHLEAEWGAALGRPRL